LWALAGLIGSTVIAFLLPNRYESTASLMPPDTQSITGGALMGAMTGAAMPSAASGLTSTLLGAKSTGATFVGMLQSRTAKDDLINRFDLRHVYRVKGYREARLKLADCTAVKNDNTTGIITITVTDNDPRRARDLASGYIDELNVLVNQLSTSSARRERIFLEERVKAVKGDLDSVAAQLSQFSSRNGTLDMQNQGKAMLDAASHLQGELIVTESELRSLESIYGDSNVRVRAAEARAGELRSQLRKISGAEEDRNAAALDPDQLYPSLRKLPLLGVTYYDLSRRMSVQESVYEILTKQYELAKVQEAKEIPSVKVLDQPVLPERESSPHRLQIMLAGMLVALLLAAIGQYAQTSWQAMDVNDPRRILASDVLSVAKARAVVWRRRQN
jgi:capsule polysaccharide export protein KpsE/RkpR